MPDIVPDSGTNTEVQNRLFAVIELDLRAILRGYNVPRADAIPLCSELRTRIEKYFKDSGRTVRMVKFASSDGLGTGTPRRAKSES